MQATLRLASRVRLAPFLSRVSRLPITSPQLAIKHLQQHEFCSYRPPRPKTKVCPSSQTEQGKSEGKIKHHDEKGVSKNRFLDCCNSGKDGNEDGRRQKAVVCDEDKQKFSMEVEGKEKEREDPGESSESEGTSSSDDEKAKAQTKECSDEESSDHSEEEEQKSKAASDMCGCAKTAAAKAVEEKTKALHKPVPQKDSGKPLPSSAAKERAEAPTPKLTEHVKCCNVEKPKSASEAGESGGQQCKSFRTNTTKSAKGIDMSPKEVGSEKDSKKEERKKNVCGCIKSALEKCSKDAAKGVKKEPATKKADTAKQDQKKPEAKSSDKKSGPKDPEEKDLTGKKMCNKKIK